MSAGGLQFGDREETIKSFLNCDTSSRSKELKILVYLDNEGGNVGIEIDGKGGSIRRGKILLEIWTLRFE